MPLHSAVVIQLRYWLALKGKIGRDELLFNLRSQEGSLRRTSKMMEVDLKNARVAWIDNAATVEEREQRETSDFLQYCDENGLYADFHANRHTFITNLANAGVHPKLTQSVARHSDVNLTLGIYSHVEQDKQADAINALPAPPSVAVINGAADSVSACRPDSAPKSVDQIVDQTFDFGCLSASEAVAECPNDPATSTKINPCQSKG